jgi:hypothetical protein
MTSQWGEGDLQFGPDLNRLESLAASIATAVEHKHALERSLRNLLVRLLQGTLVRQHVLNLLNAFGYAFNCRKPAFYQKRQTH